MPTEEVHRMTGQMLGQSWLPAVALGSSVGCIFLLLWVAWLSWRLRRLQRLLQRLMPNEAGQPLDELLERLLVKQEENRTYLADLDERLSRLHLLLQGCLQRVGLVRFDAFQDTAGQQSFAVALLDNLGNGVVITSLFGRSESRCYAKPVVKGESSFPLSDEERAAIRQALEQPIGTQEATPRHVR